MASLIKIGTEDEVELKDSSINYLFNERGTLHVWSDPSKREPKLAQCGLLKARNGTWVVLDYSGYLTKVEDLRVADCKIVCNQERISIAGLDLLFREIDIFKVKQDSDLLQPDWRGIPHKCPYDKRKFSVGEIVVKCPRCGEVHHLSCWQRFEDGHCSACSYKREIVTSKVEF